MFKSFSLLVAGLAAVSLISPLLPPALAQTSVPIAVLDFQAKGGVSSDEASIISDRVRTQVFRSGRFQVMERANMLSILKEQGFQQTQTGCESTSCSVEAGKLLAVRQIMTGSVSKLGAIYTLSFRIVDVERGEILRDEYRDCRCSLEEVLTRLTGEMVTELTHPGEQPQATPAPTAPTVPDSELALRFASLPLAERQAFYGQHEHFPLVASALNFPVFPWGYIYLNDWDKFWIVGGTEVGLLLLPAVAMLIGGGNGLNFTLPFSVAGLIITWGYGLVDGFMLADQKNKDLKQLLKLGQDPFAPATPFGQSSFSFATAPTTFSILSYEAHF